MEAEVIAIGPFSSKIVEFLDYSPNYYSKVSEGAIVLATLITCVGTSQSEEIAAALGFSAWDFNAHHVDLERIDRDLLFEAFDTDRLIAFDALVEAGFSFYFRPNG
jgi:hypothetical protein